MICVLELREAGRACLGQQLSAEEDCSEAERASRDLNVKLREVLLCELPCYMTLLKCPCNNSFGVLVEFVTKLGKPDS